MAEQLYVGGSMVNIAAAATHSTATGLQINMYHGVCSWGDGQLEGVLAGLCLILLYSLAHWREIHICDSYLPLLVRQD